MRSGYHSASRRRGGLPSAGALILAMCIGFVLAVLAFCTVLDGLTKPVREVAHELNPSDA